jgi:hypothetical protein
MTFNHRMQFLNVVLGKGNNASCAHHWLDPQSCYLAVGAGVHLFFSVFDHRVIGLMGAPVNVGVGKALKLKISEEGAIPGLEVGQSV